MQALPHRASRSEVQPPLWIFLSAAGAAVKSFADDVVQAPWPDQAAAAAADEIALESEYPFSQLPFDGIFGLGLRGLSAGPDFNFVARLKAGAAAAEPVFAIFLRDLLAEEDSEISLGGFREERLLHGGGGLRWLPMPQAEADKKGYWLAGSPGAGPCVAVAAAMGKPRAESAGGGLAPDGREDSPPPVSRARRAGPIGAIRGCYEEPCQRRDPPAAGGIPGARPRATALQAGAARVHPRGRPGEECQWPHVGVLLVAALLLVAEAAPVCRVHARQLVLPHRGDGEHLEMIVEMGVTLFAFDFAGCGMSEGDTITLGWNEKDDARCVIDFLRASGRVSTVALWGRSMGAATALLHGHRDPSIAALILDSPFADLHQLAREVAVNLVFGRRPGVLVSAALRVLRSTIQKRSGLDMFRLKPIENAGSTFIPALFVAGDGDSFIAPSHSWDIHSRYAGDKNLVMVAGDHDSRRPGYLHDSIAIFLGDRLLGPAAAG
ncbi:unnamed protein product [Prorocentrum cordatum]|uniref:Serine aminopeptidase S33 domain-containing protein n=1 Tax=Prorocentrum cordatum TaxID=2364126 RepID=A0ABN9XHK8_9DINO|nr:unnamed protein product [Polarella glacialis]